MPTIDEQVTTYLKDVHSIEEQALSQMKAAPGIAGDPELSRSFEEHLHETQRHERLVRERLEARGEAPSKLKSAIGRASGVPFVLFARSQPDTPGKLVVHAHSYEHMELAAYELLERAAQRAGDEATAALAREIRDEEAAMIERLAAGFDTAVEASLRAKGADDLGDQVVKYLGDAHALEAQAIQLGKRAAEVGGEPELQRLYGEHLDESRRHGERLEARLEALGAAPSRLKDTALAMGALNWAAFFGAQPDTPAKLAGFAFAFEALEVAAYELLERVARRAGDDQTAEAARAICVEERAMAARLQSSFDRAMDASLQAVGAMD